MMLDTYEWGVQGSEFKSHESKTDTFTTDSTEIIFGSENYSTGSNSSWLEYARVCSPGAEDLLATPLFQALVYVMYGGVFVVALTGNGLVCFVVWSSPRMKTVTNYFIVNLAVGDILMTLFCVPFSFVSVLVLRYWPFGALMCKVVNYSQAVSVLVSAYTLLAISLDRYAAIMRPLRPRLGRAAAKLLVAAVWGGAMATAAPISVVSQLQKPTEWHRFCQADICLEQWERREQSAQYTCALLALQFALPLGALVCTYARIAHAVWGGRPPGEAQSERDSRMQRSKRKMIKMMVAVVAVFTVCWLPLNVFIVLWSAHEQDEAWGAWPGMPFAWLACHWLAMSHSCCNPVIYCYMNARYRRGFQQAFGSMFCMQPGKASRSRHRSSLGEGMPMSEFLNDENRLPCRVTETTEHLAVLGQQGLELLGVNITRRGTNSSCAHRLQRAPTCSSCASSLRRAPAALSAPGAARVDSVSPAQTLRVSPTSTVLPPVRALSVRTNYR